MTKKAFLYKQLFQTNKKSLRENEEKGTGRQLTETQANGSRFWGRGHTHTRPAVCPSRQRPLCTPVATARKQTRAG